MGNKAVPNNRHYHQGRYSCVHPNKYLGDLTAIYYRSSWEKKLYYYLDNNERVLRWVAEGIAIPYEINENGNWSTHNYYPDVYCELRMSDGNTRKTILEIKPSHEYDYDPELGIKPPREPKTKTAKSLKNYEYALRTFHKNIIKWQAAKKYCDRRGIEFHVITPKYFDDKNNPKVKLF
jgi:hypothetical protein